MANGPKPEFLRQAGISRSALSKEFGLKKTLNRFSELYPRHRIGMTNDVFPTVAVTILDVENSSKVVEEFKIALPVLTADGRVISTMTAWLEEEIAKAEAKSSGDTQKRPFVDT